MWSDEELGTCALDAMSAYHGEETIFIPPETLERIMTRAVELVVARGGTMTAGQVASTIEWLERTARASLAELRTHITAQGARVAVLERDLDLARKGFDPGSPADGAIRVLEAETAIQRGLITTLQGRLSFIRPLISQLAALSVEMAKVGEPATTDCPSTEACAVCGSASGFPCNPRVRRHLRECGDPSRCALVTSDPCSPTCTHDDAAIPGHAERVRERSDAFTIALDQAAIEYARETGAEAMRAACLEAVRATLQGFGDERLYPMLKAAIEGAVP